MSFSRKNRNLRAGTGNGFPVNPAAETDALLADVIARALKEDFGATPSHVKHLARLTGANERTVHNWLLARNGPSGTALIVLMRHSDAVAEAVLTLADRNEQSTAIKLLRVRHVVRAKALELVDCLGSP